MRNYVLGHSSVAPLQLPKDQLTALRGSRRAAAAASMLRCQLRPTRLKGLIVSRADGVGDESVSRRRRWLRGPDDAIGPAEPSVGASGWAEKPSWSGQSF